MIFDVLDIDGDAVTHLPYSARRAILDDLNLNGARWRTPPTFDDGEALWEAICEHDLEGLVAKKLTSRYVSGDRGWVKVKNREYWRWELERESALNARPPRRFVSRVLG